MIGIRIATALGVDLEAELHQRVKRKNALNKEAKAAFHVLNADELWHFIKAKTAVPATEWASAVFGSADAAHHMEAHRLVDGLSQQDLNKRFSYSGLKSAKEGGMNWCHKSAVTGQVPSRILAEIRNVRMNDVPAVYVDPGMVNPIAGVWRVVDGPQGNVKFHSFRLTNGYYHDRTGVNRARSVRSAREQQAGRGGSYRCAEGQGSAPDRGGQAAVVSRGAGGVALVRRPARRRSRFCGSV